MQLWSVSPRLHASWALQFKQTLNSFRQQAPTPLTNWPKFHMKDHRWWWQPGLSHSETRSMLSAPFPSSLHPALNTKISAHCSPHTAYLNPCDTLEVIQQSLDRHKSKGTGWEFHFFDLLDPSSHNNKKSCWLIFWEELNMICCRGFRSFTHLNVI